MVSHLGFDGLESRCIGESLEYRKHDIAGKARTAIGREEVAINNAKKECGVLKCQGREELRLG